MSIGFREPATQRFGDFELDVYSGVLRHGGETVPLRAKSFQVLRLLVENPGRLIACAEILEAVWPGRIVTDDSVHKCVAEIRAAIGDARHRKIRTVHKRGYRFDLPVSRVTVPGPQGGAFRVGPEADPGGSVATGSGADSGAAPGGDPAMGAEVGPGTSAASVATGAAGPGRRRTVLLILGLSLLAAFAALRGPALFDTSKPAVAAAATVVAALPLANASPDRQVDAFVVGFHDVLLAELSRQPGLQIIGRWSLEHLGDEEQDAATLRRRLGADLALTGSVARDEAAIVFTFQLHDTRSGIQRWARSYTEALDARGLLRLQRRVAAAVAREAAASVARPSAAAAGPAPAATFPTTDSLSAYEHYLDGLYFVRSIESGPDDPALVAAGRRALEAAIEADPGWAPPYAALGRMLHFVASGGLMPAAWRESWRLVDQALALDPDDPEALVSRGFLQFRWGGDYAASERTYRRVPGDGYLVNWGLALLYRALGRIEDAITHFERALRTDPLNPTIRWQYGEVLACDEQWLRAREVLAPLETVWGDNIWFQLDLAVAEILSGQGSAGRARWERHGGGDPLGGFVHLALGEEHEARLALERLAAAHPPPFLPAVVLAAQLGEAERALGWLEPLATAGPEEDQHLMMLCYASIRALEGRPRFDRLLAELHLR